MALNLRNIEEWRNWSNGVGFSWEEQAFAEDTGGLVGGGTTWPPRSYACTFCRKEFRSAQALGGHMNIHRRDRARLRQGMPIQNSTSSTPSPQQQHDQTQTIAIPCAIASANQPQKPSSLLLQRHHSDDDYGNAIPLSWGANNGFTTTYSIVDARPPKILVPSLRAPSTVDAACQSPPSTVLSMALQSKFTSNHHESAASSNESSDSSSDSKTNKRKNDMDLDLEISDRHTHTKSFLVSWTNNPNRSVGKKNFIAEIVDLDAPQDLDLELRLGDGSASSSFHRNPSRIHHS